MIWNKPLSAAFEVLNGTLVGLCGLPALERTEVASPPGLRIFFARVQPVLAGF
jgi:hypothetical protein